MTTAPFLPEIDLAVIAPLPIEQKWKALQGFKQGRPPYSYKPVRQRLGDLLRLETPLFGAPPEVPFEQLATVIRRSSRSTVEAEANIRVAASIYAARWNGRPQHFAAMGTTIGHRLEYWTPAVLNIDGRAVVPYFNPRQSVMPSHARRFVFSMMHEQIRVPDPDYAAVAFCINHFSAPKIGPREMRTTFDDGVPPYGFDELQAMVAETYAVWAEVWAGRIAEARRSGSSAF